MRPHTPKIISLAMTGASGVPYGLRLLQMLVSADKHVYLMISPSARIVFAMETNLKIPASPEKAQQFFSNYCKAKPGQIEVFSEQQWGAPVASGSAKVDAMVVCPCTSGALAAIANGTSDNLIERAADVMIKENRQLILVHRETPLSAIHLENSLKLARLGVSILPANPGFYHAPKSLSDLVDFIVARILDQLNIEHELLPRWGGF